MDSDRFDWCCEMMAYHATYQCDLHDRFDCPDVVVHRYVNGDGSLVRHSGPRRRHLGDLDCVLPVVLEELVTQLGAAHYRHMATFTATERLRWQAGGQRLPQTAHS